MSCDEIDELLAAYSLAALASAEMAGQEGIPLGTAKSRLRLALVRMREMLSPRVQP